MINLNRVYGKYNRQCALWNRWGKFYGRSMPLLIQFKLLDPESRRLFELEPWVSLPQHDGSEDSEDISEVD